MKTYWYLFPILGYLLFLYDVFTWNNTKIPPVEEEDIWQYAYPFYSLLVHLPLIVLLIFVLFIF
jgi:hypothetical protein